MLLSQFYPALMVPGFILALLIGAARVLLGVHYPTDIAAGACWGWSPPAGAGSLGVALMRILYGVQATGNGHITRARVLLPALRAVGIEVDLLLSGRAPEQLFNMEGFGHFATRRGFTFATSSGGSIG